MRGGGEKDNFRGVEEERFLGFNGGLSTAFPVARLTREEEAKATCGCEAERPAEEYE
jgi:hypothetical protein